MSSIPRDQIDRKRPENQQCFFTPLAFGKVGSVTKISGQHLLPLPEGTDKI